MNSMQRNRRATNLLAGRWPSSRPAALAVLVPREPCHCGAVATECLDGVMLCATHYDDEIQAHADAARDSADLRNEISREPRR